MFDIDYYLNNDDLKFYVANASQLTAEAVDVITTETSIIFWIITAIILSCVMIAICVSMLNKRKRQCCYPVDNQNWLSFLLFGLSIYDVITNIYLLIELLLNEDGLNNTLLISGIVISIFSYILRMTLNAIYCYTLPQSISYNIYATNWYRRYKNK